MQALQEDEDWVPGDQADKLSDFAGLQQEHEGSERAAAARRQSLANITGIKSKIGRFESVPQPSAAAPVQKRQRKTGWLGSSADTVSEGSNDAITAIHAATAPHTPQQSKRTRSEPTQAPVAPASSTASSVGGIFGRWNPFSNRRSSKTPVKARTPPRKSDTARKDNAAFAQQPSPGQPPSPVPKLALSPLASVAKAFTPRRKSRSHSPSPLSQLSPGNNLAMAEHVASFQPPQHSDRDEMTVPVQPQTAAASDKQAVLQQDVLQPPGSDGEKPAAGQADVAASLNASFGQWVGSEGSLLSALDAKTDSRAQADAGGLVSPCEPAQHAEPGDMPCQAGMQQPAVHASAHGEQMDTGTSHLASKEHQSEVRPANGLEPQHIAAAPTSSLASRVPDALEIPENEEPAFPGMQPSAQPTELQSPAYLPSPHRRDSSQEHVATWQAQDSQAALAASIPAAPGTGSPISSKTAESSFSTLPVSTPAMVRETELLQPGASLDQLQAPSDPSPSKEQGMGAQEEAGAPASLTSATAAVGEVGGEDADHESETLGKSAAVVKDQPVQVLDPPHSGGDQAASGQGSASSQNLEQKPSGAEGVAEAGNSPDCQAAAGVQETDLLEAGASSPAPAEQSSKAVHTSPPAAGRDASVRQLSHADMGPPGLAALADATKLADIPDTPAALSGEKPEQKSDSAEQTAPQAEQQQQQQPVRLPVLDEAALRQSLESMGFSVNASMDSLESPISHLMRATCDLLTSHDTVATMQHSLKAQPGPAEQLETSAVGDDLRTAETQAADAAANDGQPGELRRTRSHHRRTSSLSLPPAQDLEQLLQETGAPEPAFATSTATGMQPPADSATAGHASTRLQSSDGSKAAPVQSPSPRLQIDIPPAVEEADSHALGPVTETRERHDLPMPASAAQSCMPLAMQHAAAELKVSDAGSILAHTPWQRPAMQLGTRQAPAKTSSAHVPAVTQQSHPTQAQQPVAQEGQAESSGVVSTATDVALDLVQQDLPQRAVEHIIGAKHPAATSKLDEAADAESPTGQAQTTCLAEAGKPSTPLSEHPAGANSADALSPARARDQVVSPTAGSSVSRKARNACQPSVALPDSPEAAPAEAEDMVGSAEGCGPQSPAQSSSTFTNLTNNEIFSPDSHTMTGPAGKGFQAESVMSRRTLPAHAAEPGSTGSPPAPDLEARFNLHAHETTVSQRRSSTGSAPPLPRGRSQTPGVSTSHAVPAPPAAAATSFILPSSSGSPGEGSAEGSTQSAEDRRERLRKQCSQELGAAIATVEGMPAAIDVRGSLKFEEQASRLVSPVLESAGLSRSQHATLMQELQPLVHSYLSTTYELQRDKQEVYRILSDQAAGIKWWQAQMDATKARMLKQEADFEQQLAKEKREHEQTKASFATLHSAKYLPLKAERAELQERCQGLSIARREAAEAAERSRLGWAGADARAATAELDAKHAEQNAKHAVKELTAAKAVTDVLREKLEAVQQALTDKELELAAVSSAGAAESGAQSASYLQKEIAVLKCRNERLGHESCRLRDKLQTQAAQKEQELSSASQKWTDRQAGLEAQVVSLHSQLAVKQEEFADLAKLAEGLVADLEARASPSQDYI